jgi:hypothetical protein
MSAGNDDPIFNGSTRQPFSQHIDQSISPGIQLGLPTVHPFWHPHVLVNYSFKLGDDNETPGVTEREINRVPDFI